MFQEGECSYCVHTIEKMSNKMRITKVYIRFGSIYVVTLAEGHLNRLCCYVEEAKVKMCRHFLKRSLAVQRSRKME